MEKSHTIVVIGKLGHGKTHLVNKLCNTAFQSVMCAESCTRENQFGISAKHGFTVIDTPGFGSSHDTSGHIRAQQEALEGQLLSGIYVVVKYGSPSDMAESLNRLMDFAGSDDVRIIVTYWDTVQEGDGVDAPALKQELTNLVSVPIHHILLVGKDSAASAIEDFVFSTLHDPRQFRVEREQVVFAASLTVGARRYTHDLNVAQTKLRLACNAIQRLNQSSSQTEREELAVTAIHDTAQTMVHHTMSDILKQAKQELTPEALQELRRKIQTGLVTELEGTFQTAAQVNSAVVRSGKKRKSGKMQNNRHIHEGELNAEFVAAPGTESWSLKFHLHQKEIDLDAFLRGPPGILTELPQPRPKFQETSHPTIPQQRRRLLALLPPNECNSSTSLLQADHTPPLDLLNSRQFSLPPMKGVDTNSSPDLDCHLSCAIPNKEDKRFSPDPDLEEEASTSTTTTILLDENTDSNSSNTTGRWVVSTCGENHHTSFPLKRACCWGCCCGVVVVIWTVNVVCGTYLAR